MPLPQENKCCLKCYKIPDGRDARLGIVHTCKDMFCPCHQPTPVENKCEHIKALEKSGITPPEGYICRACNPSTPLDIGKVEDWEKELRPEFDTVMDSVIWDREDKFEWFVTKFNSLLSSHTEKLRKEIEKAEQEGYRAGKTAYKRYTKGIEGWKKMGEDNGYLQIILKEVLLNNEEVK